MSRLREVYSGIGSDMNALEGDAFYLSQLTVRAAIEVDNHILGRNNDFSHLGEFGNILGRYQPREGDDFVSCPNFPYLPLWRAIRRDSEKDIRKYSELALEMRLLRGELERVEEVPSDSEKLKNIRSLLNNLSVEFLHEQHLSSPARLVA